MGYLHVEIATSQVPMKSGTPCGDVVAYERTASSTTMVVSDGMGHGIKAHIAAQMVVARTLELLRQGYSLRKAFACVVDTLSKARGTDLPYAVFTVVRILNDGVATILTYDMPPPVFVSSKYAQVLPQRKVTVHNTLVGESNCHLAHGEGIVIVSDGITQAGLGMGLVHGWTIEGTSQYISDCVSDGIAVHSVPESVLRQARGIWKDGLGDDCTVAMAACRRGKTVNILTGPPGNNNRDTDVVKRFMTLDGTRVVCGGTTAQLVAKALGREMQVEQNPQSMLAPPRYMIEGIDLVTEGAVTLNQVYNVLDEDPDMFDEESGVTELHELLMSADRINLLVGTALNPATKHISFRQRGILTRHAIIPLLAQKLRDAGKLVVLDSV